MVTVAESARGSAKVLFENRTTFTEKSLKKYLRNERERVFDRQLPGPNPLYCWDDLVDRPRAIGF